MIINRILKRLKLKDSKIEQIQIKENVVNIHLCRQEKSYTIGINAVIKNEELLSALNPIDASTIGYFYGMSVYSGPNKTRYPAIPFNYLKAAHSSSCKIFMLDRLGNIAYINQLIGEQYVSSPLQLLLDKYLINQFSPLQACYIGILSGIISVQNRGRG